MSCVLTPDKLRLAPGLATIAGWAIAFPAFFAPFGCAPLAGAVAIAEALMVWLLLSRIFKGVVARFLDSYPNQLGGMKHRREAVVNCDRKILGGRHDFAKGRIQIQIRVVEAIYDFLANTIIEF